MDVVRELRRKQDNLKGDRQALLDQMAEIDKQIAALDTVIKIWQPDHLPTKAVARRRGKSEKFLDGFFEGENFTALILDTLRLAQVPIPSQECALRIGKSRGISKDDPRMREMAGRVLILLSGLAKRKRVEQIKEDGRASLWRVAA